MQASNTKLPVMQLETMTPQPPTKRAANLFSVLIHLQRQSGITFQVETVRAHARRKRQTAANRAPLGNRMRI